MENNPPWTLQMLANQIMTTNETLSRHMQGCEDGQRQNTAVILDMSSKLDTVVRTVDGYQRVISGSWTGVGRVLVGVIGAVAAAVVVLAIQNVSLHKDTAAKVEGTASTLASVTATNTKTVEDAQRARDEEIIALLKHHH